MKVKDIFNGYDKRFADESYVCINEAGFVNPISIKDCIEQYGDRECSDWNLGLTRVNNIVEPCMDIYLSSLY